MLSIPADSARYYSGYYLAFECDNDRVFNIKRVVRSKGFWQGMKQPRAAKTQRRTRIQQEKEERILGSALDVFSANGFRGSTIDQIAAAAGMSKPNLLYYFRRKEDIHQALITRLMANWLAPLAEINADGEPIAEIRNYLHRKIEMAQKYPRESRLFANEILQGAPRISLLLRDELKPLVDEKAKIIRKWISEGKIAMCDPHHLIFSIWATTQHYADFDAQVQVVLGDAKRIETRFDDATEMLERLFLNGLKPQ